jgi:hypothetical protein
MFDLMHWPCTARHLSASGTGLYRRGSGVRSADRLPPRAYLADAIGRKRTDYVESTQTGSLA